MTARLGEARDDKMTARARDDKMTARLGMTK